MDDEEREQYFRTTILVREIMKQQRRGTAISMAVMSICVLGLLATIAWNVSVLFMTGWTLTNWQFWAIIQPGSMVIGGGTIRIARIVWRS